MQAKVPVAIGERVAALAVVVQAGGPGDDDAPLALLDVVDPFDQIPPARVLVDLIEDQQRLIGGQLDPPEPRCRPALPPCASKIDRFPGRRE